MHDIARVQAVIDLVSSIEEAMATQKLPADAIISSYFRTRRYAGSKDRRFIIERVYQILREREVLVWMLKTANEKTITARALFLASAIKHGDSLEGFMVAHAHGPSPITAEEQALIESLKLININDIPAFIKANIPEWARVKFETRFAGNAAQEAEALNQRAEVHVRVNTIKSDRKTTREALEKEGIECVEGRYAPTSLVLSQAAALQNLPLYRDGWVEMQDEAAQIASVLVDAKPNHKVVDLCAGAGGKSLAIAAFMQNDGMIFATDINQRRLKDLEKRAKRAGASIIRPEAVEKDGDDRVRAFEEYTQAMDRVVVDAPCSGSGTWRRNPDQRWRFGTADIEALQKVQSQLLTEGAALCKVGGRLIYMTCSLFEDENEGIIDTFLNNHPAYRIVDWKSLWGAGNSPLKTAAKREDFLLLTPLQHSTDGFFIAILERFD